MKYKFKVGDKVQVTKCVWNTHIGAIGTIKSLKDSAGDYSLLLDDGPICCPREIKLIKPVRQAHSKARKVAKKKPIYYNTKYDFICSKEWCHITVKHSHVGRPRKEPVDLQVGVDWARKESALSRLGQIAVPVKWFEEEVTFKITKLEDGTELIFIPTKEWSVHQTNIPKLHVLRKVKK